jgi:thioredoxin-related protein
MIDFMTSWCGWCKKLDDEVYTKPDVMEMSTRFVCIRVDAEQRSDLARTYAVDRYPTIIFLDPTGLQTNRVDGYVPAQGFLEGMRKSLPPKR